MFDIAYAMGTQGGGTAAGGPGGLTSLLPLILMFAIFYFLLIRPQQKKAKEHRDMVANLKKGDRVMTTSGIYGRIVKLDEEALTVEIADKVNVKIGRAFVGQVLSGAQQAPAKLEKENDPS